MNKLFLLLLMCFACGVSYGQIDIPYTLIFIDKSVSSNNDAQAKKDFESKITKLLSSRYRLSGSKVKVKFLHEGTLTDHTEINYQLNAKLKDCEGCGAMKKKYVEEQNRNIIQEAQKTTKNKLLERYTQLNTNSSNKFTDIWGSLELISRLLNTVSTTNKLVIFSSDMVESMSGKGRRDFHKVPIKNKEDAIKAAKQDLIWIKSNLSINTNIFKGLKIAVWPPANTLKGSDSPYMIYYWEALFSALGVQLEWAPSS